MRTGLLSWVIDSIISRCSHKTAGETKKGEMPFGKISI
jgi:hypothetical protein